MCGSCCWTVTAERRGSIDPATERFATTVRPIGVKTAVRLVAALVVALVLAACGAEEEPAYEPQLWVDRAGNELPSTIIQSDVGPEHCGWQSATILSVGVTGPTVGEQYLRDPRGLFLDYTDGTYDGDTKLPAGAKESGYHRGEWTLWLTPNAAYVVTPSHVERWPVADQRPGCA